MKIVTIGWLRKPHAMSIEEIPLLADQVREWVICTFNFVDRGPSCVSVDKVCDLRFTDQRTALMVALKIVGTSHEYYVDCKVCDVLTAEEYQRYESRMLGVILPSGQGE